MGDSNPTTTTTVDVTKLSDTELLDYLRGEFFISQSTQLDILDKKYDKNVALYAIPSIMTSNHTPYTAEYLRRNYLTTLNGIHQYDLIPIHEIVKKYERSYLLNVHPERFISVHFIYTPIVNAEEKSSSSATSND